MLNMYLFYVKFACIILSGFIHVAVYENGYSQACNK